MAKILWRVTFAFLRNHSPLLLSLRRPLCNPSSSEQNFDDSSDLELFFDEEDEEYHDESSDEEAAVANQAQVPQNAVHWSPTLQEINVADFSLRHGPTKDLGENATLKDYSYQFLDDAYLEEIVRCSVAYARSKGDNNFTANRSEISAFLGLNILRGIHDLPQIQMYWDSDEFVSFEGFKKTIPKQRFFTLSKYIHLVDPATKDRADLLCKVRPLVNRLEEKFSAAYVPGKNITVDEGLVKFNGRLSFKQCMPLKPDKFGIKVWFLADADTCYVPRFQVYLGKNRTNNELFREKGLGFYEVWTLGEPYLDNH